MLINNNEYFEILTQIKTSIRQAQYKAILGANREQIILYWNIGKAIIENNKHGSNFIENLARDIKTEFPNSKGYSARNLRYMQKFAKLLPDEANLPTVLADLSWSHIRWILDGTKSIEESLWYANQAVENGWSLSSLEYHLDTKVYSRQVIAEKASNYAEKLPTSLSGLATDTLKSPYVFDFVEQREGIIEREIERELVANIAKTLMELGTGFAFVGNQYHMCIENEDYYIDLLFYNTKLRCYVVIELKAGKFKPEYAGKLNFYLSAVDDLLKHEHDNPTIGIMLCKERSKLTAEYALKDINKPIGVSEYKLSDYVPAEFADTLPSAEDIERRVKMEFDIDDEGGDEE